MSGGVGAGPNKSRFWYDSTTGERGFQIKLTNKSGANSVKGQVVIASATVDDAYELAGTDELEAIGIVYEGGVPDGSDAWVWTGQGSVCQVLLEDGTAATRGYWVRAGGTTGGRADATTASAPGVVLTHFYEIGHCLENKGSGTDVLAKILFHTL